MRIAVCLSGQPRAIEFASKGLLNYFSNNNSDQHTFDFFCHSWNYNTWKTPELDATPKEVVDFKWLSNQLLKFSSIESKIGVENDAYRFSLGDRLPYGSLLYSAMASNFLKRKYEIRNNFRYDCVYKVRYDSVFNPDTRAKPDWPFKRNLYAPHYGRMPLEYNRFNFSDVVYYGDSWSMDIASDLYRYVMQEYAELLRDDGANCFGPGTLMTTYAQNLGIELQRDENLEETIYRKEVLGLDPTDRMQYNSIRDMHRSFYTKRVF